MKCHSKSENGEWRMLILLACDHFRVSMLLWHAIIFWRLWLYITFSLFFDMLKVLIELFMNSGSSGFCMTFHFVRTLDSEIDVSNNRSSINWSWITWNNVAIHVSFHITLLFPVICHWLFALGKFDNGQGIIIWHFWKELWNYGN